MTTSPFATLARLAGFTLSKAGLLAVVLPLGAPITVMAAGSEPTFVVVSGRQAIHDGEQVCFRLDGDDRGDDRLSVRVRFTGQVPRGSLELDGYGGSAFNSANQTFTFNASTRGIHRLKLVLRDPATIDWMSVSAASSRIEQVACSAYENDANRRVRLETPGDEPVYRFERPDARADARDDRIESDAVRDSDNSSYWPAATLPAGTNLELSLDQEVGTQTHRTGQQVSTHLSEAVTIDGRTVLPAGTRIVGSVTESRKAGRFGRARLALAFGHAILEDGTSVPISARVERLGKGSAGKQTAIIAGSAVGGAVAGNALGVDPLIGAVVGGGIATGAIAAKPGKPVILPAGTVLVIKLDNTVDIPRSRRS